MNLLLLLSALLSALTGVGGSVRSDGRAQAVAEGALNASRVAFAPRIATLRPQNSVATLVEAAVASDAPAFSLMPGEPAFATRRRE
ncbi:hypothetical protein [Sphingomonas sp. OV641]|uniref:hypothetical protein n=1 Tax=Sphingomonas sp. OV641 TaxID=1881068 RepID=UPI00115FA32F|nr:hypothetical protein [Sphingomonas sp. OV641]